MSMQTSSDAKLGLAAGKRVCFMLRGKVEYGRVVRVLADAKQGGEASRVELSYCTGVLTQTKIVKLGEVCP